MPGMADRQTLLLELDRDDHPDAARDLNNLATLLQTTNRLAEAEPLMRRHWEIFLKFTRATGHPHPQLQAIART